MTRILVVDDLAIFREPIVAALRANGYEAIWAENGREALRLVKTGSPDLILLDVSMPVMDGLEYLRTVEADRTIPRPPVILLTAVAERDYIVKAAKLGVKHYLVKSQFSLEDLLARIAGCLERADSQGADRPRQTEAVAGGAAPAGGSPATDVPKAPSPDAEPVPASTTADDAAALKAHKSLMTRSQVIERLEACGELKAFSPAVARVRKLTQSERTSIESIARAIKQDHAMAVKILKLANSVVYTRGERVETIEKAVLRIGLAPLRQVMLNIGVVDQFSSVMIGDETDGGQFWEHAIGCGIIAAEIAHARSEEEADLAFTMGLVHDVGRIIYTQQFGEDYATVMRTAAELRLPLEQVETRLLVLNHADGMDRLLHTWKFPKELIDPIVLHHLSIGDIRRMAPRRVTEVATLALANRLCHALALGSSGNETIYPTEEFCEVLKLEAAVVHRIEETAREQTDDLKLAMLAESKDGGWDDCRERYRSALAAPLRPLFVSDKPHFDAFRIFFDQLAERSIEPPNVGIVHVGDTGHRMRLSQAYAAEEARAGVKGLPLIILSPNGNLALEPRVMAGRMHHLLPTPVTVARLLAAINDCLARGSAAEAA